MNYEYKPSFDKTIKKMRPFRKKEAIAAVLQLIDFFESGIKSRSLGLAHLRGIFWEIRFNIKDRIIFSLENNTVSFIIAGDHNDIQRF